MRSARQTGARTSASSALRTALHGGGSYHAPKHDAIGRLLDTRRMPPHFWCLQIHYLCRFDPHEEE